MFAAALQHLETLDESRRNRVLVGEGGVHRTIRSTATSPAPRDDLTGRMYGMDLLIVARA
jgi:hypothetical protein